MSDDFDALRELGATMGDFAEDLGTAITFSSNRYMEFMPQGVTKATGLAKLAPRFWALASTRSSASAIRLTISPCSMLQAWVVGVANATDDACEHCDVVLNSTCFDGALPELVERFLEP